MQIPVKITITTYLLSIISLDRKFWSKELSFIYKEHPGFYDGSGAECMTNVCSRLHLSIPPQPWLAVPHLSQVWPVEVERFLITHLITSNALVINNILEQAGSSRTTWYSAGSMGWYPAASQIPNYHMMSELRWWWRNVNNFGYILLPLGHCTNN